jgi:oligopeptide/dipeptide ABC transporter ATP-binding protein
MMTENNGNELILEIKNLKVYFYTDDGVVKAVDGIDFHVKRGEILALVGESGCGKSVTSFSIMQLVDSPGKIVDGEVLFNGENLLEKSEKELIDIRGKQISMIFQQPQTSLDPVYNIADQISEVFRTHSGMSKDEAKDKAVDLLRVVGIPDPVRRAKSYPHQMSGGQAQRVMIAMALALQPALLLADEPTTALDVTIQAQILDLLRGLQSEFNTSVLLITHDLGVVAETAERVAVMYAGRIMEIADVETIFESPLHPYTRGLIASVPVVGLIRDRLDTIQGNVPNLINLPAGCRFADRCDDCMAICTNLEPDMILYDEQTEHQGRCWLYQDCPEEGHVAPVHKKAA